MEQVKREIKNVEITEVLSRMVPNTPFTIVWKENEEGIGREFEVVCADQKMHLGYKKSLQEAEKWAKTLDWNKIIMIIEIILKNSKR